MSNWQLINEFTVNALAPKQGDPVVRINRLTKFDGTNVYSVQVGSVGPDFPSRLGLFLNPVAVGDVALLIGQANVKLDELMLADHAEQTRLGELAAQEAKAKAEKDRAKRQRREGNLAARKAENQARAHGGGNKKK